MESGIAGAAARLERSQSVATASASSLAALLMPSALRTPRQEGVQVEVVDPRTLAPLDTSTIVDSVTRTHRLLICHEAVERFGWAGEIAMQVMEHAFDELDAPIGRVCAANAPVPYSDPLEQAVIPGEASIEAALRAVLVGSGVDSTA